MSEERALHERIARSGAIVVFTGAGVSTECGVPDFRSPGSPWLTHPPIGYDAFRASAQVRAEAWRRKFALDDCHRGARPGRGHRAIAALAREGRVLRVVTQNIDGLHQAAGLDPDRIDELHGNGTFATCLDCGARHELEDLRPAFERSGIAPVCACGGPVKSATISFGQAMPRATLARATAAARACDFFIVLGSSLVVQPAAGLPVVARRAGAALAIVNRTPTPLDAMADIVLNADIGTVLERYAR